MIGRPFSFGAMPYPLPPFAGEARDLTSEANLVAAVRVSFFVPPAQTEDPHRCD
ncbi:MAG: hypothetical protein JWN66_1610 [Sphingomonas bacterium]|nr:hypothetical protein [Sphingomonas bacterium]